MVGSGVATAMCVAGAYIQWNVNRTCATALVCIEVGTRADGAPICKDITCGFPLWVFVAPAAVFGVITLVALFLWALRPRPRLA